MSKRFACMSVTKENLAPPPDGNIDSVLQTSGLPWWLSGKESAADAGDMGSTPGLGRSPGEGNGNPLRYPFFLFFSTPRWEISWTEEPGGYSP